MMKSSIFFITITVFYIINVTQSFTGFYEICNSTLYNCQLLIQPSFEMQMAGTPKIIQHLSWIKRQRTQSYIMIYFFTDYVPKKQDKIAFPSYAAGKAGNFGAPCSARTNYRREIVSCFPSHSHSHSALCNVYPVALDRT